MWKTYPNSDEIQWCNCWPILCAVQHWSSHHRHYLIKWDEKWSKWSEASPLEKWWNGKKPSCSPDFLQCPDQIHRRYFRISATCCGLDNDWRKRLYLIYLHRPAHYPSLLQTVDFRLSWRGQRASRRGRRKIQIQIQVGIHPQTGLNSFGSCKWGKLLHALSIPAAPVGTNSLCQLTSSPDSFMTPSPEPKIQITHARFICCKYRLSAHNFVLVTFPKRES